MINDCAFVGETLYEYLPLSVEKLHIKRTRGVWSKTFGVAYKILRAKADVYHVHYLLQDCFLATKFGKKPLIGHAMGSDLRQQLKSRKWGWVVRSNLKNCDKILVCQPTILEDAKKFNQTAEYFPIPFNPKLFFPKPLPTKRKEKQVFIASAHDFAVKGTDKFIQALASINLPIKVKALRAGRDSEKAQQLARKLNLNVSFVEKVAHEEINKLYWESDLVLGSFSVGQLDTVAIEAMACGRPVVHSISKEHFPECPLEQLSSLEEATELIFRLVDDEKEQKNRVQRQLEYVDKTHSAPLLVERLMKIYSDLTTR